MMDLKNLKKAVDQIAEEKGINSTQVLEAIESSIAAAYKKEFGKRGEIVRCKFDSKTGDLKFWQVKSVVDEDSSLVSQAISSTTDVPQLLTQIDTIAKDSGLNVSRLSYSFGETATTAIGGEKVDEKINEVVIVNLGAQGSYPQVKNFAQNLEDSSRLINIKDFRFSLDNDTKLLDVVFVLESPYQFVNSTAVTDDPVNLDISKEDFVNMINKVKGLKYYNIPIENISEQAQKAAKFYRSNG